jgi:hypothetical protein
LIEQRAVAHVSAWNIQDLAAGFVGDFVEAAADESRQPILAASPVLGILHDLRSAGAKASPLTEFTIV